MSKRRFCDSTKQGDTQQETTEQQTKQTKKKKNGLADLIGSIKEGEYFDAVKDKQILYK